MDKNVFQFKKSEYIQRTAKEMVENCIETLPQIKHMHTDKINALKPYKENSLSADVVNLHMNL